MNKSIKNRNNKYKIRIGVTLSYNQLSLGYHSFQVGCIFAEFDLFNPSIFMQNYIYINSCKFDRNIRYNYHGSRSRAKKISFQPTPLSFFHYSPIKLLSFSLSHHPALSNITINFLKWKILRKKGITRKQGGKVL